MDLDTILTRIFYILPLVLHVTFGKALYVSFTGQLMIYLPPHTTLPSTKTAALTTEVVSRVSANANFAQECIQVDSLEYQLDVTNSTLHSVYFTISMKQKGCLSGAQVLSIDKLDELGITDLSLHTVLSQESEFWQDKMNSILVFGGCAAVLIIMLVTCIVMTTGCYKKNAKNKKQTYAPSKPHLYQPYAIDTMTLDHRKYSRKENFQPRKQYEPTTIERWVNSQLSKGRRQSSATDLLKESKKGSVIRTNDSHHDLSTTDSGIETTAPRRPDLCYTSDIRPHTDDTQGQFRRAIAEETYYQEPQHVMCNSIDYVQHNNAAYIRSVSNEEQHSFEESSQL